MNVDEEEIERTISKYKTVSPDHDVWSLEYVM